MKNDMMGLASRHVIEGRKIVERQRRIVEKLKSSGRDAAEAKRALDLFERTLAIFEEHLQQLTEAFARVDTTK